MLTTTAALALALGLLAPADAKPAPDFPLDAAGTSRDFDRPPLGSAGDQALWRSTHDANNTLLLEQHVAQALMFEAKTNVDRLGDPAFRGSVTPEAAEELVKPLVQKWNATAEVMGSVWPISKLRGCRYELMNLDAAMLEKPSPRTERQLDDARRDVNVCLDKATRVLKALTRANDELRAANTAAERALGPAGPPEATAGPPGRMQARP